jgi:hypothetical protein
VSSDSLSDPLVATGLLLGLAGLILIGGLALHLWSRRGEGPLLDSLFGSREPAPGTGVRRESPGETRGVAPAPAESIGPQAPGEARPQREVAGSAGPWLVAETGPPPANRAGTPEARQDFAPPSPEADQAMRARLDEHLQRALRQLEAARDSATGAIDEGVRRAMQTKEALEGEAAAVQSELAKSGEMAAAEIKREGDRVAMSLRDQERRAAEKLSRKALRRERRLRREGEVLVDGGEAEQSGLSVEDFEVWARSFSERIDAQLEEFRRGSEERLRSFDSRLSRLEDAIAAGAAAEPDTAEFRAVAVRAARDRPSAEPRPAERPAAERESAERPAAAERAAAGADGGNEEIKVRIERLKERVQSAHASVARDWLPDSKPQPETTQAGANKPGSDKPGTAPAPREPARATEKATFAQEPKASPPAVPPETTPPPKARPEPQSKPAPEPALKPALEQMSKWVPQPETRKPAPDPTPKPSAPPTPPEPVTAKAASGPNGSDADQERIASSPLVGTDGLREEDRRWVEQFLSRTKAAEQRFGRTDQTVVRMAQLIREPAELGPEPDAPDA